MNEHVGVELRALIHEHIEAIEWLKRNISPRKESLNEIMQAEEEAGNVKTIRWHEENDVDAEDALWSAHIESKWETAKWIIENCEMDEMTINWTAAARCGALELKYAYALEVGSPNKDAMHAAAGGHSSGFIM